MDGDISKWERGENLPDLTFVPAIASYYNVTVDDLLGVGKIRKEECIQRYTDESFELLHNGKVADAIMLWREARHEFPNDLRVLGWLAFTVFFKNFKSREDHEEVIELEERILRESTDERMRRVAVKKLCLTYNALGDKRKAREYAEMCGSVIDAGELLLSEILEGQEGDEHNKALLCLLLHLMGNTLRKCDYTDGLTRCEFFISLCKLFFDDDFMGIYAEEVAQSHYECACIYAGRGDEEKVREHLEQTVKYVKQYDSLGGEFTYGAALINGLRENKDSVRNIYNFEGGDTIGKCFHDALVGEDRSVFDRWQKAQWFRFLLDRLKEDA